MCALSVAGLLVRSAAGAHDTSKTTVARALTAELNLTDLTLATEARYTRHLSQADLHSAFQDHPTALEHFPSGSFFSPPLERRRP